jgi:hypothetical protein
MKMKEPKSIIKKIRRVASPFDGHLASIYGEQGWQKPSYYLNIENQESYVHIAGGFAFPTTLPGFAVIVGVTRDEESEPALKVLAEAEEGDLSSLLDKTLLLRNKYGYEKYPDLLETWFGDFQRYNSFVSHWNLMLEKKTSQENRGIYLSPPPDWESPYNGLLYWRRIKSLIGEQKQLYFGSSSKLRTAIQKLLAEDDGKKKNVDQYPPAVMALGYVVHALVGLTPWLQKIQSEKVISTREDNYEAFASHMQGEAYEYLFTAGPEDTGELFDTIPK